MAASPQSNAPIVGEEAIIQEFLAPLAAGHAGALGLVDDCALLRPPPGTDLVMKTDPVRAGVHFFQDDDPADIAWKALAVNVSDLVAKGATPLVYLAALSFPQTPTRPWLARFAAGLKEAQAHFGCHLVGGDTDRAPGPLSITITAIGSVPAGRMVRRDGARPGDRIFVTGQIGNSGLGLRLRTARQGGSRPAPPLDMLPDAARTSLLQAYLRPDPPIGLAPALLAHAHAAMDISDGLVKDLDRLCRAAGVGARVDTARVPVHPAVAPLPATSPDLLAALLTAGDDYQVLATVPAAVAKAFATAAADSGIAATDIGEITASREVVFAAADGGAMTFARSGWDHF